MRTRCGEVSRLCLLKSVAMHTPDTVRTALRGPQWSLPRLECDSCSMEAETFDHQYRHEFGGVESVCESLGRTQQDALARTLSAFHKTSSCAGTTQSHEQPSALTGHRASNQRDNAFHQRPIITNRLDESGRDRCSRTGTLQRKNVPPHARALFDVAGASVPLELVTESVGARAMPDE